MTNRALTTLFPQLRLRPDGEMHVQEERKGALGPGKGLMVGLAGQTPRSPGSDAPVVSFRGWSPSRADPHLPLPVIPGACPSVWPRDGPGSLCLGRKELSSLKERISLQPWNVPGVGRTLRREGQPVHPPAPRHTGKYHGQSTW